jgi:hypothetical protein
VYWQVVGFVNKALVADTEFDKRMERERALQEKLEARKKQQAD